MPVELNPFFPPPLLLHYRFLEHIQRRSPTDKSSRREGWWNKKWCEMQQSRNLQEEEEHDHATYIHLYIHKNILVGWPAMAEWGSRILKLQFTNPHWTFMVSSHPPLTSAVHLQIALWYQSQQTNQVPLTSFQQKQSVIVISSQKHNAPDL